MVLISYPIIKNEFFSLEIKQKTIETYLRMQLVSSTLNTVDIPQTNSILSKLLPTIHSSTCFNDKKLPFIKEVTHTEIGHLFEHILLEYLYQSKTAQGKRDAVIKGETSWNWKHDPKGMFHIVINIGFHEGRILPLALQKSITLLEKILFFDPYFENTNLKKSKILL